MNNPLIAEQSPEDTEFWPPIQAPIKEELLQYVDEDVSTIILDYCKDISEYSSDHCAYLLEKHKSYKRFLYYSLGIVGQLCGVRDIPWVVFLGAVGLGWLLFEPYPGNVMSIFAISTTVFVVFCEIMLTRFWPLLFPKRLLIESALCLNIPTWIFCLLEDYYKNYLIAFATPACIWVFFVILIVCTFTWICARWVYEWKRIHGGRIEIDIIDKSPKPTILLSYIEHKWDYLLLPKYFRVHKIIHRCERIGKVTIEDYGGIQGWNVDFAYIEVTLSDPKYLDLFSRFTSARITNQFTTFSNIFQKLQEKHISVFRGPDFRCHYSDGFFTLYEIDFNPDDHEILVETREQKKKDK